MSDETVDKSTIREYLLGDLPESESERVERWYFSNGQAVDEVWATFSEMAEERLIGALAEDEARRFDQKLRSSPAMLEMFEHEMALRDYAARNAPTVSRQVKTAGRWPRIFAAFFRSPGFVAGGVAMLSLVALGLWSALKAPESPNSEGSRQAESQNQRDQQATNSVPQPSIAMRETPRPGDAADKKITAPPRREITPTFLLLAGGTRGGEDYPTFEIPSRTETVQMEIEPPTDECPVFSAVLQTESGEELQRWERLRTRRSYSMTLARMRVKAVSLKNAVYALKLECVAGSNNPAFNAEYRFKVEKK